MHWSINSYPGLAGRPRAERQAILQAALKRHGRVSGLRLLIVIVGVIAGTIAASVRLAPHARLLDWRTWLAPAAAALFIYAYLLIEINGAVHTAVKQYLAAKDSTDSPSRRQRS